MTRAVALVACLLLGGCPAISAEDLENRTDLDGDHAIGRAFGGDDCDDRDPKVHPGAPEVCDGVDDDCDGLLNEEDPGLQGADWWLDADGDGYGRADTHVRSCAELGVPSEITRRPAWVHDDQDCDDTDREQHPGQQWDLDGDGDGWGVRLEARRLTQCTRPVGYVRALLGDEAEDCDDANRLVHPSAAEVCDEVDDDCDGLVDADDPTLEDGTTIYPDADGDHWGDKSQSSVTCGAVPTGSTPVGGDCDDADASVAPGHADVFYDDVDSDCLGNDDFDADGDGVRSADYGGTDCDDTRGWVYPGAPELCDGMPDDCDTAATWTIEDEDPGVSFVHGADPPVEWTAPLRAGGHVVVTLAGTLWFCGDGPWTGSVELRDPRGTSVLGATGHPVLDASGTGEAAIRIDPAIVVVPGGPEATTTVRNLELTGGEASCIDAQGASLELDHLDVHDCTSKRGAGGAQLAAAGAISVHDSQFWNDHGLLGGGLAVVALPSGERATLDLRDSALHDNVADQGGGGLYAEGPLTAGNVTFQANQAPAGGGLLTEDQASLVGVTLAANGAEGWRAEGTGDRVLSGATITDQAEPGGALDWAGVVLRGGTLTCGDGTRILRNDVGLSLVLGTFTATDCNLGGGNNDNAIDVDVTRTGTTFDYDATTTAFTCDPTGCTP